MPDSAQGGGRGATRLRAALLVVGAAVAVALVLTNDWRGILATVVQARFAILLIAAAHLLVVLSAAEGWRALLPRVLRPGNWTGFRLRLIKESVNALLPVAQVGGDVVRARLAVRPPLTLRTAAASCLVDAFAGLASLAVFILSGLAAASVLIADPRSGSLGLQLAAVAAVIPAAIVVAERLGLLNLVDRAAERSEGVLGQLSGLSEEVRALSRRPGPLLASAAWHLVSWGCGVLETWIALKAVGAPATGEHAFVLESLTQGARALGFAVPGALGVQEGGYLLICAGLGIPAEKAVALSLIRRLRELLLGASGLALWRFRTPALPVEDAQAAASND